MRTLLLLALALLIGCETGVEHGGAPVPPPDSAVPVPAPTTGADPREQAEQRRALGMALDTLEALVVTLERIEDPIGAWNRAAEVARLLNELERTRSDYALGVDEHEAAQRFPAEVDRLKRLETRRDIEMNRIMQDRVIAQVLAEEIAKAERAAAGGDTTGTVD